MTSLHAEEIAQVATIEIPQMADASGGSFVYDREGAHEKPGGLG
jgi:hypothetical protein